jgi:hypothetical protein
MAQKMTPNEVVAWNLWQERKARGWSQEQVSSNLADHGIRWEKATYYAAEASRLPDKPTRRFSADELIAFALIFRKPVAWFLTPPDGTTMVFRVEVEEGNSDLPLYLSDLLQMGLQRDLPNMTPLAERLREVATAIETFEEERQPKSGAQQITEALEGMHQAQHPELYGETGRRRQAKEIQALSALRESRATEAIRELLAIEQELDSDEFAHELASLLDFYSDVVSEDPQEALRIVDQIRSETAQEKESSA